MLRIMESNWYKLEGNNIDGGRGLQGGNNNKLAKRLAHF